MLEVVEVISAALQFYCIVKKKKPIEAVGLISLRGSKSIERSLFREGGIFQLAMPRPPLLATLFVSR